MRRPVLTLALAVAATTLAQLPTAAPSDAASVLQLGRWVADPSGTDVKTNAGRNRETIEVRNTSAKAIAVAGYRVKDRQNHTFVFPKGYVIKARSTVVVHTGSGTNTAAHVYWKQGNYVWNNTGDTAYLQTPKGASLDTCVYKRGGTINC